MLTSKLPVITLYTLIEPVPVVEVSMYNVHIESVSHFILNNSTCTVLALLLNIRLNIFAKVVRKDEITSKEERIKADEP
jgi:hypothetical protein